MSVPGRHFVRNMVERRALVMQLVRRDFHQRYVGTAAGWLWGIVNPLVQLAVWYFVFQVCLKMKLPRNQSYALFVMAGYLPWMLFQETVMRSASSLVEHKNLITRTVFPSEVVAVSIFLSSMIHHLIGVALVLAAVFFVTDAAPGPFLLLLPLYMACVGLLGVGFGWVASSLHVYLRDTGQVLAVVMTVWLWMTPVMISPDLIPPEYRFLMVWNPMSWIVDAYRARLLDNSWPDPAQLGIIAVFAIGTFVAGGLFFRHLKRGFADVL